MITIVSNFHNRPDFIPLQLDSIRKYVVDDEITYLVVNSAEDELMRQKIALVCKSLGIPCFPIKRDYLLGLSIGIRYREKVFRGRRHYKNGNLACSYTLMYVWKHLLGRLKPQMLCIIDSDMFFFKQFDPKEILASQDGREESIAFVPILRSSKRAQWDIYHPWNGLFLANGPALKNLRTLIWHPGRISGIRLDVGGQGHYWLKNHKGRVKYSHFAAFSLYDHKVIGTKIFGKVTVNGSFFCEFESSVKVPREIEITMGGSNFPYFPMDLSYLDETFGAGYGAVRLRQGIQRLLEVNESFRGPNPKYFDVVGVFDGENFDATVFHYKSVSNYQTWSSQEYNDQKTLALVEFLDKHDSGGEAS